MTLPSQIDKYRLIKRLGGESFSEVYLSHDQALASNTAIKLIKIDNPSDIPSLIQEAQILYECRHKHVVEIREANAFHVGADYYLVFGLEYLPEGSIEGEMKTRWMSVKESCIRVSHVLSGLQYAHSKNYLHRDIKPGNILIDGNSSKLSDFGLASMKSLYTACTMSYHPHCPPEYFLMQTPTVLFDIFAIGVTLFRIANNYSNWRAQIAILANLEDILKKGALIQKIGYQKFIPRKLKRIINRACRTDPSKRYQDAMSFKNDLDSLRFYIDWVRLSVGNWQGTQDSDSYELKIIPVRNQFNVEFKKNMRCVKSRCSDHSTFDSANEKVETIISETIFL